MHDSLEQLHAAYTTRADEIANVVARVTHSPISKQEKIARGFDNEVHSIITGDGEHLYVHIRRHGELPFTDIAWALGEARVAGAPVPEVVLCDRAAVDGAEREIMIQRALPGEPLQAMIATLDDDQLRTCYLQAAAALATIHGVPVDGFGMRRHGVWDFSDWEQMTSRLGRQTKARTAMLGAGLSEDEVTRVDAVLDRLQRRFPCPRPALLHGDFGPGHLLFDATLTLTGILDFGQLQGGSPIVDFDLIFPDLLHPDGPEWGKRIRVEYLRDGYGPTSIWDDFAEHRLLYVVNEHVTYLTYHTSIGDMTTVARLAPRLRALLELAEGYRDS